MKHSPNTPETSGMALAAAEPEVPEMVPAQIDPMVSMIERVTLAPEAGIGKEKDI